MKKILFVICFLVSFYNSKGQLFEGGSQYSTTISSTSYSYEITTTYGFKYRIKRDVHGYWYRFADFLNNDVFLVSRTAFPYLTLKIPCNVQWLTSNNISINVYQWSLGNAASLYSNTITFFSPMIGNYIFFSGPDCEPILSNSSSTGPNGFVPPSLTSAAIAALPLPIIGTLVWDITVMCLKVYNGTAWVCL